ncbi:MAG TPA: hypothetical protein VHI77_00225 [Solirubrobacterales bacterium]|nr:hypothetical protein [Solirubrobacterales bacterium]
MSSDRSRGGAPRSPGRRQPSSKVNGTLTRSRVRQRGQARHEEATRVE